MKRTLSIIAALATAAGLHAAVTSTTGSIITYTGGTGESNRITVDTVWTSDMTYILDGIVYVTDGASLTIEGGTLIKASDGAQTAVSALVIARGSKIYALGTPSAPIVMTSIDDPIASVYDTSDLNDLDTGLWGGLVVLGDGLLNSSKTENGSTYPNVYDDVEGIVVNDYTEFGGSSNDNSQGIIRYISIRHAGQVLNQDNELNGLTLGGVTDKTIVEFVEIFSNSDDSIEIFGGNVNPRFIVSAFPKDDSFDWDSGWTGYGQFWLSIGSATAAGNQDHGAEMDGLVGDVGAAELRGMGTIFNSTIIGPGSSSGVDEGLFEISDDAGVRYYNSIFTGFGGDHVIHIKDDALSGLTEIPAGDTLPRIDIQNNIWFDFAAGATTANWVKTTAGGAEIFASTTHNNTVEDPMFRGVSRVSDGNFDPRPAARSPAWTNARFAYPNNDWFIPVDFQGAFGDVNWMLGWTKLSIDGYLGEISKSSDNSILSTAVRASLDIPSGEVVAVGLIITGTMPKMVLIRAEGAGLADNNVANPASATELQIFNPGTGEAFQGGHVWTNWADADDAAAIKVATDMIGLEALDNDTTSGVALLSLNPGGYAISVKNPDGTGGEVVITAIILD